MFVSRLGGNISPPKLDGLGKKKTAAVARKEISRHRLRRKQQEIH